MRQVFLDTETTGLDPNQGHRIIEIAAVEINNRQLSENQFHVYTNPEREIDAAAQEVHGITLEFLKDKSLFKDIAEEFLNFVQGSELIIHNAPFDIGFLKYGIREDRSSESRRSHRKSYRLFSDGKRPETWSKKQLRCSMQSL